MAKPPLKKYILKSEIERVKSKHPDFVIAVDKATIVDDDGVEVVLPAKDISVPPSERWSDDVLNLSQTNAVAAARVLLGVENYRHFVAAGGSATILFQIAGEHSGADLGESSASDGS